MTRPRSEIERELRELEIEELNALARWADAPRLLRGAATADWLRCRAQQVALYLELAAPKED